MLCNQNDRILLLRRSRSTVHLWKSPFAALAEIDCGLFGNALCYVHPGAQACHAHVGRVALNERPTLTTKAV